MQITPPLNRFSTPPAVTRLVSDNPLKFGNSEPQPSPEKSFSWKGPLLACLALLGGGAFFTATIGRDIYRHQQVMDEVAKQQALGQKVIKATSGSQTTTYHVDTYTQDGAQFPFDFKINWSLNATGKEDLASVLPESFSEMKEGLIQQGKIQASEANTYDTEKRVAKEYASNRLLNPLIQYRADLAASKYTLAELKANPDLLVQTFMQELKTPRGTILPSLADQLQQHGVNFEGLDVQEAK